MRMDEQTAPAALAPLREDELLQHGRAGEFRVQQDATNKSRPSAVGTYHPPLSISEGRGGGRGTSRLQHHRLTSRRTTGPVCAFPKSWVGSELRAGPCERGCRGRGKKQSKGPVPPTSALTDDRFRRELGHRADGMRERVGEPGAQGFEFRVSGRGGRPSVGCCHQGDDAVSSAAHLFRIFMGPPWRAALAARQSTGGNSPPASPRCSSTQRTPPGRAPSR